MIHWTDKEKIIKDYKKSGATVENFAPTRNISSSSLRNWLKTYNLHGVEGLKNKKEKTTA
ncbi:helix-turn-helix domain-containing protein [Spiroplasma sp. TIUS-1]|uniref:helix-turn-helix domain-containing protein n=1 Tax=Spiroplasma sp. TIUS-1 TaxID=216963 RepID=UPI0013A70425|nr:helix-turn-helix domain-containing protein [Spiroplasma sp. TIUS-1]